jgi:hypothetical protein
MHCVWETRNAYRILRRNTEENPDVDLGRSHVNVDFKRNSLRGCDVLGSTEHKGKPVTSCEKCKKPSLQ